MAFDIVTLNQQGWKLSSPFVSDHDKQQVAQAILEFTDRDSYLQWVADWKHYVTTLERQQRQDKAALGQPHQQLQTQATHWGSYDGQLVCYAPALQRAVAVRAYELTQLRLLREGSKLKAGLQRAARKAVPVAV